MEKILGDKLKVGEEEKNSKLMNAHLGKVFFPFNTRLSRIQMQAFYAITSNVKIGNT